MPGKILQVKKLRVVLEEEEIINDLTFDMEERETVLLFPLVFFVTRGIFGSLILAGISEDLEKVRRINLRIHQFYYLFSIALIVALGVRIMGGLMTAALVAIPACAARNGSGNLFQYSYGGLLFGSGSCLLGMVLFRFTGYPIGPLIVLASTFLFLVTLLFRRRS